jgi:peptidoglycan/xylan/chitin deacetylase (PgdA/CDA1 family)
MANRENNYRGRVERDDIRVSRYVPEEPGEKVAGSGSASDVQRRVQQRGQRRRQPASDVRVLRPGDGYRTQPPARAEQARAYAERHRKEQRSRAVRRGVIIVVACVAALVVGIVVARGGAGLALPSLGGSGSGDASATQGEQGADSSQDAGQAAQATVLENDGSIVMTLGGSADTYVKRGEDYVDGGCYAHDRTDGMITDKVTATGEVDTSTLGDYTVTYTVEDSAGMVATATRTVHVVDDVDGGWDGDGISVFMYHDVYDAANPPEGASEDQNLISTTLLDQQLSWLNENGYYFPSWAEIRAYIDGGHSLPAKSVVLTFDDGSDGFLTYAIPLLESHKIPATSFVICSDSDIQDKLSNYASPYVDFQSHSYDLHRAGTSGKGHGGRIYDLTAAEISEDLKQSADILKTSDAFAYPYGDVSDAAPSGVKQSGFLLAFTTQYGQVHVGDDPTQLKRMRVFGTYELGSFEYQAAHGVG